RRAPRHGPGGGRAHPDARAGPGRPAGGRPLPARGVPRLRPRAARAVPRPGPARGARPRPVEAGVETPMTSITTWNRIEPTPRATRLTSGLRAEVADPLWLLTRQRQVGELTGEDAGSPVEAVVTVEVASLGRYHAGRAGNGAAARAVDLADATLPLETLVERRPVGGSPAAVRLAADGGAHLVRLLRAHGAEAAVQPWVDARRLDLTEARRVATGPTAAWLARHDGVVPDGAAVAADLDPLR